MYYWYPCSYCGRVFYTFQNYKETAAEVLFNGIKNHLVEYNEDDSEYEFDDRPDLEVNQMYYAMHESLEPPYGAYELS